MSFKKLPLDMIDDWGSRSTSFQREHECDNKFVVCKSQLCLDLAQSAHDRSFLSWHFLISFSLGLLVDNLKLIYYSIEALQLTFMIKAL